MAVQISHPSRRTLLVASAAVGGMAFAGAGFGEAIAGGGSGDIRPFRADIPQEMVDDLRRRIAATRWPERETVTDRSQGNQLATMQDIVNYWGTDYDWRRGEANNSMRFPNSRRRSTASTFISFTSARAIPERCPSSSRMAGPVRSSRCWASSVR